MRARSKNKKYVKTIIYCLLASSSSLLLPDARSTRIDKTNAVGRQQARVPTYLNVESMCKSMGGERLPVHLISLVGICRRVNVLTLVSGLYPP